MLRVNGSRTRSGPVRMRPAALVHDLDAELGEGAVDQRKVLGREFFTSTVPPVMAPSAMKVTISWKSSAKRNSPPRSARRRAR
jgi:hypothetical protein